MMTEFIIDCSVTMAWCFKGESTTTSNAALEQLATAKGIVPPLWCLEIINVLQVALKKKKITLSEATTFLKILKLLPIEIDSGTEYLATSYFLELTHEYSLSAYDAAYLELALRKKIPLSTMDENLKKAAKKASVKLL